MTALATDKDRAATGGDTRRLPLLAGANPFAGSFLSFDKSGYVNELVAGQRFAGVCLGQIPTGPAANGGLLAEVRAGLFQVIIPITSVAITDIGASVYATDDNAFSLTQASASTLIGTVIGVEGTNLALVECRTSELQPTAHYSLAAAGTALSDSTTRTALASFTIKAGTLKVGSRIRVRGQAIATATNSTDTLTLDVGGAVGGTPAALIASTATDVANNNIGTIDCEFVIRTLGDTGTLAGFGKVSTLAASGTAAAVEKNIASTTINTNADLVLGFYGTWSVANAGNSCRADDFTVDVIY